MKVFFATSTILLSNASLMSNAFAPARQPRTRTSRLSLVDPALVQSAVDTSSIVTADFAETLGQLALILPLGLGIAAAKGHDYSYDYFTDSTAPDLAMLEVSPAAVAEKAKEEPVSKVKAPEPQIIEEEVVVVAEPEPKPVPVVTAQPGTASIPSKDLLEKTEEAKSAVAKKGVADTKQKMESKSKPAAETPAPAPVVEKAASTEVADTKKPGRKRQIAKGLTLVIAAGTVALGRNVVKAWLGRGML